MRRLRSNLLLTTSVARRNSVLLPGVVLPNPPQITGSLADRSFVDDTGGFVIDPVALLSLTVPGQGDLTGVSYNLTSTVSGVTVRADGKIDIDTDVAAVQADAQITWRAANAGGAVTAGFLLTITEPSSVTIDTLTLIAPQLADGSVDADFTMSEAGDHAVEGFYVLGSASNPTEAQFDLLTDGDDNSAASGLITGTLNNANGTINLTASVPSPLNDEGHKLVLRPVANPSAIVASNSIPIDTSAPVLTLSVVAGDGQVTVTPNMSETGSYRVVLVNDEENPTVGQIELGNTVGDVPALRDSGLLTASVAGDQAPIVFSSLTNNTVYDVFGVAEDGHANAVAVPTVSQDASPVASVGHALSSLGSKLLKWDDYTDGSVLFTDATQTTTVGDGGAVGFVKDKSDFDNDTLLVEGNAPVRDATNGHLSFDNVDGRRFRVDNFSGLTNNVNIHVVLNSTDTLGVIAAGSASVFAAELRNSGAAASDGIGTPTYEADFVAITDSRYHMLVKFATGNWVVASILGADLSDPTTWGTTFELLTRNSTVPLSSLVRHFVVTTNDLDAGQQATLEGLLLPS